MVWPEFVLESAQKESAAAVINDRLCVLTRVVQFRRGKERHRDDKAIVTYIHEREIEVGCCS